MCRCDVPGPVIRFVSVVMFGGPVPMSNIMPAIVRVRLGVVPISADVVPEIGSRVTGGVAALGLEAREAGRVVDCLLLGATDGAERRQRERGEPSASVDRHSVAIEIGDQRAARSTNGYDEHCGRYASRLRD